MVPGLTEGVRMKNNAVVVEDLTYEYPGSEETPVVQVFEGLSLDIEEGTFVAVLGHNGCGKSTLARHFNAIVLPTLIATLLSTLAGILSCKLLEKKS